jgi:hypothetical protein
MEDCLITLLEVVSGGVWVVSGDALENLTNGSVGVWGRTIFRSSEPSILKGVVSGDSNMMFTVSRRKNPKWSDLDTRHFKLS